MISAQSCSPQAAHWRLLLGVFRQRRGLLARVFAWSAVAALPAFLSGRLVAAAVDRGFLAGRPMLGFAWLGLLLLGALAGAVGIRQTYLRLAELVEPFRDDLVDLVVSGVLHRCTISGASAGSTAVARLTHQVDMVRESFASIIMVTQVFLVTTTSALLGLFALAPLAVALVLPPILLGLGLFLGALRAMANAQREALVADEGIAEAITTVASGLRDVVACGGEDQVREMAGRTIDTQQYTATRLARVTTMRTTAMGVGMWLPLMLILAGSPWLVSHGATTGTVLGAITYVSMALQPALRTLIRGVGGNGLWLLVTLRRIVEAAELPFAAERASQAGGDLPQRACPSGSDLELRGVTFTYGRQADPVIFDLDLVVPDGDHLAVVGPSGVGKSTLAGIMAGVLEPQAGQALLGGVELRAWGGQDLAGCRVLIPQEAYVFAGTVEENLTYLRDDPGLTDIKADIDEAVDVVGARELIERLGGYGAVVDPAALSAGERQLLTLARAYLSPARLVILDEATCHLDPAADARVERAFAQRLGTLIVMAHRISSAMHAKRILVLDGTRAQLGTHQELLECSALYRDLVGHWQPVQVDGAQSRSRV
ncbi:MAG: ABC transporter ATP-binding protein/permease [Actinomycetota bacterium]|nr:ABC transporter ATP-binding protein/permease [Actinomycetota bacterium]